MTNPGGAVNTPGVANTRIRSIDVESIQLSFDFPKLCECGCGQPVEIAKWTNKRHGTVAGQPRRFRTGHNFRRPLLERFWAKVQKTESCWLWTAGLDTSGYGYIVIGGHHSEKAHRFAYALLVGPIPMDLYVLHRCDVRNCVNPDHLFLGTQADNTADMVAKQRQARGNVNHARLNEQQVLEIRALHSDGVNNCALARRYGVSDTTIWAIVHRKKWRHI